MIVFTLCLAPSTINGISQIVFDNITEFPTTINVLKRFNLYPELVIGITYRMFDSFTKASKIKTMTCWKVRFIVFVYLMLICVVTQSSNCDKWSSDQKSIVVVRQI